MIRACVSRSFASEEKLDTSGTDFPNFSGRETFSLKFDSLTCR